MLRQRILVGLTHEKAIKNYIKALNKGILKVMSKMGISTLQSYCGAQVFEAVGLDTAVRRHLLHANGVADRRRRHRRRRGRSAPAPPSRRFRRGRSASTIWSGAASTSGGATASITSFNPDTVFKLQHSTRSGQYAIFKEYTQLVDDQNHEAWRRFAACSS